MVSFRRFTVWFSWMTAGCVVVMHSAMHYIVAGQAKGLGVNVGRARPRTVGPGTELVSRRAVAISEEIPGPAPFPNVKPAAAPRDEKLQAWKLDFIISRFGLGFIISVFLLLGSALNQNLTHFDTMRFSNSGLQGTLTNSMVNSNTDVENLVKRGDFSTESMEDVAVNTDIQSPRASKVPEAPAPNLASSALTMKYTEKAPVPAESEAPVGLESRKKKSESPPWSAPQVDQLQSDQTQSTDQSTSSFPQFAMPSLPSFSSLGTASFPEVSLPAALPFPDVGLPTASLQAIDSTLTQLDKQVEVQFRAAQEAVQSHAGAQFDALQAALTQSNKHADTPVSTSHVRETVPKQATSLWTGAKPSVQDRVVSVSPKSATQSARPRRYPLLEPEAIPKKAEHHSMLPTLASNDAWQPITLPSLPTASFPNIFPESERGQSTPSIWDSVSSQVQQVAHLMPPAHVPEELPHSDNWFQRLAKPSSSSNGSKTFSEIFKHVNPFKVVFSALGATATFYGVQHLSGSEPETRQERHSQIVKPPVEEVAAPHFEELILGQGYEAVDVNNNWWRIRVNGWNKNGSYKAVVIAADGSTASVWNEVWPEHCRTPVTAKDQPEVLTKKLVDKCTPKKYGGTAWFVA